jgi:hypothetical protein
MGKYDDNGVFAFVAGDIGIEYNLNSFAVVF